MPAGKVSKNRYNSLTGCENTFIMSLKNTTDTGISVATCNIISKNKSLLTLSKCDAKSKCPLDDIGKNSVKPWINPSIIA
jgi:hypothetical protein